jgi:hypothetical protein
MIGFCEFWGLQVVLRAQMWDVMLGLDRNWKIRTRNHRTEVGKHSLVHRTIKSWNQLHAGLLASFPCKLNTFKERVKNVVTSKGIECEYVEWTDGIYVR